MLPRSLLAVQRGKLRRCKGTYEETVLKTDELDQSQ